MEATDEMAFEERIVVAAVASDACLVAEHLSDTLSSETIYAAADVLCLLPFPSGAGIQNS